MEILTGRLIDPLGLIHEHRLSDKKMRPPKSGAALEAKQVRSPNGLALRQRQTKQVVIRRPRHGCRRRPERSGDRRIPGRLKMPPPSPSPAVTRPGTSTGVITRDHAFIAREDQLPYQVGDPATLAIATDNAVAPDALGCY